MTIEHRRQCRNAMWNWGLIEQQQNDIHNASWAYALRKTAAYYERTDPIRSGHHPGAVPPSPHRRTGGGAAPHRPHHLSEGQQRPAEHPGGVCRPDRRFVLSQQKAPAAAVCRAGAYWGVSCWFGRCSFSLGVSQRWWQEAQLPPQPSPFQPPFLEIQTTARANRTTRITRVMIPRTVSMGKTSFLVM